MFHRDDVKTDKIRKGKRYFDFFNINFLQKKSYLDTIRVATGLDPDQVR